MSKKILFATNTFGQYERQDIAMRKAKQLSDNNPDCTFVDIQFKDNTVSNYFLQTVNCLTKSSKTILGTERELPVVAEIFDAAASLAEDVFVVYNSDIILTQKLINKINKFDFTAFGISRIELDIQHGVNNAVVLRMEPAGFDCWVVKKSWWLAHRHLFKDFLLGKPDFDVVLTALMLLNSPDHYASNDHLIYHVMHAPTSFNEDEEKKYNEGLAKDHYGPVIAWWGNFCNETFWKRPDTGRFLEFNDNEPLVIEALREQTKNDPSLIPFKL